MKLGMVGLGRMGGNMTQRLLEHDHEVVVFDFNADAVEAAAAAGATPSKDLDGLVAQLAPPRAVWIMVPAGGPTNATITELSNRLVKGDVIIDGGNSRYLESQRRSAELSAVGIDFIDAGVSGGVWGLRNGYCLMVGGPAEAVTRLEPIFIALAPDDGYAHVGPTGAGHYVKMIHNGIEYGMLQAYAEGFSLLDAATEFDLDLHEIAELWRHGSVVRSWLLDLAELALAKSEEFSKIEGIVEDSGEGRWTVEEAIDRAVAAPVITASLFARFSSRDHQRFASRLVAALRNEFGGHKFFTEAPAAQVAEAASPAEPGQTPPEAAASKPA